jgi:methionyl aminopeptidase
MNAPSLVKTALEIEHLRLAAEALERVLADLATIVKSGITTRDIENVAELSLTRHGLQGILVGYRGFPALVCTSVNNVAAHGLPGAHVLTDGDVVTVDISADRGGFKADAAWTYGVGNLKAENRRLLRAAWRCTLAGARAAQPGARIGDIGAAIWREAHQLGCTVVREFTGHGIGHALHEEPVIPHENAPGSGAQSVPGMVFNVEPVVTLGSGAVIQLNDGWSYITSDGSVSAQYEVTVAVRTDSSSILTLGRLGDDLDAAGPPYC